MMKTSIVRLLALTTMLDYILYNFCYGKDDGMYKDGLVINNFVWG